MLKIGKKVMVYGDVFDCEGKTSDQLVEIIEIVDSENQDARVKRSNGEIQIVNSDWMYEVD